MAGRSRVAAVLPEQAAACPASLPDGVLLLAGCRRWLSRRRGAALHHGRLLVARGYGWRVVGGDNCGTGRRAALECCVRERTAEHGMLPSAAFFSVFRRADHEFCTRV